MKRIPCDICGREALEQTILRNDGICQFCKNQIERDPDFLERMSREPEEEDETPHPRNPPTRLFDQLISTSIKLDADRYVESIKDEQRLGSYDFIESRNAERWTDEDRFYEWLIDQNIPKELAEMLYYFAPEVSFLHGTGYIHGVAGIIDWNGVELAEVRQAGYFVMGTSGTGDPVVISLNPENCGEVGYLNHCEDLQVSPQLLREMFVPICESIGKFFDATEAEGLAIPGDYYAALRKSDSESN